ERAQTLAVIDTVAQRAPPPLVLNVPAHRLLDAGVEVFLRAPAELGLELGSIDCIARVMARAVSDELNQPVVRSPLWLHLVEDLADAAHHVDVAALVAAPDIVLLADPAARADQVQCPRVVIDVEPVADVGAGAVDRQRLALERVE